MTLWIPQGKQPPQPTQGLENNMYIPYGSSMARLMADYIAMGGKWFWRTLPLSAAHVAGAIEFGVHEMILATYQRETANQRAYLVESDEDDAALFAAFAAGWQAEARIASAAIKTRL